MDRKDGTTIEDSDLIRPIEPLLAKENAFLSQAASLRSGNNTTLDNRRGKDGPMQGELNNIKAGMTPFMKDSSGVSVRECVELCQKAYWNVAIFRMTIDIMSEFCNSCVHWKGGNESSKKFFEAWYKRIGGCKVGDQFFREYFRSGNIFLYELRGPINLKSGVAPIVTGKH